MKRFHFEPTSYCQLRCGLCPSMKFDSKRKGFMDVSSFKKLIEDAISLGIMTKEDEVHLYGFGEPTLHKQLDNMIEIVNERGMITKINTNGLALKPELWDRLANAGLSECLVSVDGLDQQTYQKYRTRGNFNKLKENIEYICSHPQNVKTELQFIVFSHNLFQLKDFIKFAKEVGANIATIKKPRVWVGAEKDFKGLENTPLEYVRDYNSSNCRFSDDYGLVLQDGLLTVCTADAFGTYAVGNIFKKGPHLWISETFDKLKSKVGELEICKNCGYGNSFVKKIKLK